MRRGFHAKIVAAALLALPGHSLLAFPYSWTGSGQTGNWSESAGFPFPQTNWSGPFLFSLPPSDPATDLIFGAEGGATNNDLGNPFLLNSVTFNGLPFVIDGGALQFMNDGVDPPAIINSSAAQTINAPVVLGNDHLRIVGNSGGPANALTINGVISNAGGGGHGIIVNTAASDGTVVISGNNPYAGATTINGGVVRVAAGATLGSRGSPLTLNATGTVDSRLEIDGDLVVGSLSGAVAAGRVAEIRFNTDARLLTTLPSDTTYHGRLNGEGSLETMGGRLTLMGTTGTIRRFWVHSDSELVLDGGANLVMTNALEPLVMTEQSKLTVRGGAQLAAAANWETRVRAGAALRVSGAGTQLSLQRIRLEGTAAEPATLTVEDGAVVSLPGQLDVGSFGTGVLTVRGGTVNAAVGTSLSSSGSVRIETDGVLNSGPLNGSVGSQIHLADDPPLGSALNIDNQAFNGTYRGSISGAGGLTKSGPRDQSLSGPLSYTGFTVVTGGFLVITGDATGSSYTVNPGGTLVFRGNTLRLDYSEVNSSGSSGNVHYESVSVVGGFLRGSGLHISRSGGAVFHGTTLVAGATLNADRQTALRNFTSGGTINNPAGQNLNWLGGFNTGGTLNVNGTTNLSAVVTTAGVINVNNGGTLTTAGVVGGGSRMTVNPGGTVNIVPTLELNDALLVNNGTMTGTTNVNYGSLVMGAGTFGPLNIGLGGRVSPGNSPGRMTTGATTWGPGGSYLFEIRDAAGAPGAGHDLWHIVGPLNIAATNTPNGRFTVQVQSLDAADAPGPASNFDPNRDRTWMIARVDGIVSGFAPEKFAVDASGFANATNGGVFGVAPIIAGISGVGLTYTAPQWDQPAGGSWGHAANWVGGVPTVSANFLSRATSPASITIDGDRTVAALRFDNAVQSYTVIQGTGGRLTLDSPSAAPAMIQVSSGTHTVAAPLVLADHTSASVAQGSVLRLTGGVSGTGVALTKTGPGRLDLAAASRFVLDVAEGTAAALPAGGTLELAALTIAPAATLDLGSRDMLLSEGSLSSLTALIASARNTGGSGLWSGPGLTTSAATAITSLGIAVSPGGGFLVQLTYNGDADLSGKVDVRDYFAIDRGRAMRLGGWANGDFDYSGGPANAADYMLIDRAFLTQGSPLAGLSAPARAVPEPGGALAALLLSALAGLRRRRH